MNSKVEENTFNGFEPLINNDSKILILGSFPSVKSRQNNFYYGNPQNRFWKMLSTIFQTNLPQTIEEKKNLCLKHKIALWDVVTNSNLQGSSDYNLKKSNYILADIYSLLKAHPAIKIILCNGQLAFKLFNKNFVVNIPVFCMPSTSPANTKFDSFVWEKYLRK